MECVRFRNGMRQIRPQLVFPFVNWIVLCINLRNGFTYRNGMCLIQEWNASDSPQLVFPFVSWIVLCINLKNDFTSSEWNASDLSSAGLSFRKLEFTLHQSVIFFRIIGMECV
ncbi:hypothetical protein AVEN_127439-1 [Araneus ventricosus]|uniref:Uncharacterized protein n=1 Tax=Araneus ventricosus TaxID=182803 RepID=A0A4Y2EW76_ARAVE|nr:hypothetical protein AVEN_127439-1 [Araneus ventricosus]